jgi:type IV pilus assembly protein PilB
VRRIAKDGKEEYQSNEIETQSIQKTLGKLLPTDKSKAAAVSEDLGYESLPLIGQSAYTLAKGKDTPGSPGGYSGRLGIYEVFAVSEEIQKLILQRSTSTEIQKQAQAQGMVTMREDGYLKALNGLTTLTEINRVAAAEVE